MVQVMQRAQERPEATFMTVLVVPSRDGSPEAVFGEGKEVR